MGVGGGLIKVVITRVLSLRAELNVLGTQTNAVSYYECVLVLYHVISIKQFCDSVGPLVLLFLALDNSVQSCRILDNSV